MQAAINTASSAKPQRGLGLTREVIDVWQRSSFRSALGEDADELLADARVAWVPAGKEIFNMSKRTAPLIALVVSGLARIFATSPQGRQATIRYTAKGDVIGLPVLLAPAAFVSSSEMAGQTLTACCLLHLSPARCREIASSNADNMWPLFTELAKSLLDVYLLLSQNLFQPVRARVARHLLDLSERRGELLVVCASQQDLANAIGSVREVVSRVIIDFRRDGMIRREAGVYVICDAERLYWAASENAGPSVETCPRPVGNPCDDRTDGADGADRHASDKSCRNSPAPCVSSP